MFPFIYKKSIEAPVNYGDGERISNILLQTLEQRITAEDPVRLLRDQNQITFAGGSPFSWRLLTSISYGEIKVVNLGDRLRVKYELEFTGLFVMSLVIVLAVAALAYSSDFPFQNNAFLVFPWLFLFGINYAITVMRFDSFMQDAINCSLLFKG